MPVDSNNFQADKHLSCHCNLSFFFLFPVKLRQLIDFWESNLQATLLLWMYALSSVLVLLLVVYLPLLKHTSSVALRDDSIQSL